MYENLSQQIYFFQFRKGESSFDEDGDTATSSGWRWFGKFLLDNLLAVIGGSLGFGFLVVRIDY